jgi:antagonist of KipI
MSMTILSPGPLTTVQDLGRTGCAALGYRTCGAADRYSFRLANLLAGNEPGAAALEYTLLGPTVRFEEETIFALAGAPVPATLDGKAVFMGAPVLAKAGSVLALGAASAGVRGYLAVSGGVDVPPVLGSRSTDAACRLGGFEGRALRAGDALPVGATGAGRAWKRLQNRKALPPDAPLHPLAFLGGQAIPLLRAVPGPQRELFTDEGAAAFLRGVYTVTAESNRMACRLQGPAVEAKNGYDIISDGIAAGSVQISGSGRPIVMLADHQTAGGYAKIATVITADLPVLAQLRPGRIVKFAFVTPEQGVSALRLCEKSLQRRKEPSMP